MIQALKNRSKPHKMADFTPPRPVCLNSEQLFSFNRQVHHRYYVNILIFKRINVLKYAADRQAGNAVASSGHF